MDLIRRVVIFLGITIIAIVVTYFVAFNDFEKETLPILSPRDINPELVDLRFIIEVLGLKVFIIKFHL